MHCDHKIVSDYLMDYIDNKLSPTVRKQVEQVLGQCDTCQTTYRQAMALHQASHQWVQQPVPEWHRTEYAVRPRQRSTNWLSWAALATSTIAILLVISQVQITTTENGLNIAFGGQSNSQINTLIEQKLTEYTEQQSLLLDARLVAEANKQAATNRLIAAELMEKTRNERRDDLNFLITGIQTQRFEDQQKFEKRLAYLADNQIENNQYINQLIQSEKLAEGENQ